MVGRRWVTPALAIAMALGPSVARADDTGSSPVIFRGYAAGARGFAVSAANGDTGVQVHDHPYSVVTPRGPFVLPGVAEIAVVTGRTQAARPGGALTQSSRAEALSAALAAGSPLEVRARAAIGSATAECADGVVTARADAVVRDVSAAGTDVIADDHPAPGTVLVDQPGLRVVANEQEAVPNGITVTALHVISAAGDVRLGVATAAIDVCPTAEAYGRGPQAAVAVRTTGESRGEGSFFESIPCADGGAGPSYHFDYTSPIEAADASASSDALAGRADIFLDMHLSNPQRGYLLGSESRLVVSNGRGSITAEMRSGSCASPTLTVLPGGFIGSGTWRVVDATGSFREARGEGTFTFQATVGPGADNVLALTASGLVGVLLPHLSFRPLDGVWSAQGFVSGRLVTALEVANDGPGDAFGVSLEGIVPAAAGVSFVNPALPLDLTDLAIGESQTPSLRFLVPPMSCDRSGCTVPYTARVRGRTALNQLFETRPFETVVAAGGPSA
jgi:hypothetical protein